MTDAMPALASGNNVVAFGNWRRRYLLRDRVGSMQITVDANITTAGQTKFYLRRVVGGCIVNHEALKTVKYAVS
jgi:HK97 family phage major capsid protein